MGALLAMSACSQPPARSSVPVPDGFDSEAKPTPTLAMTSPSEPPDTAEPQPDAESAPAGVSLIAAAGPTGLRILEPGGRVVAEMAEGLIVTQPTWSRDGRRLAATIVDAANNTALVSILDTSTWALSSQVARRPYFFYSWSHDGTRLAALGPGSAGGTALDILDSAGTPTSESSLQSTSIFLAWEQQGERLLVHAGPQLVLLRDPDMLEDQEDLGAVGFGFQTPAWVPGSADYLYVESVEPATSPADGEASAADELGSPRLVRASADTGDTADLGPAEGLAMMAVHPDGGRAAVSRIARAPAVLGRPGRHPGRFWRVGV